MCVCVSVNEYVGMSVYVSVCMCMLACLSVYAVLPPEFCI